MEVERIWMVYDADGGLRGELAYALGALLGAHCGLCDITHGRLRRKRSWDDFVCTLSVPVAVVHRNEQPPEVAAFTAGRTPCVVAEVGGAVGAAVAAGADGADGANGELVLLLDAAALDACAGDVDRFADMLAAALAPRGRANGVG